MIRMADVGGCLGCYTLDGVLGCCGCLKWSLC